MEHTGQKAVGRKTSSRASLSVSDCGILRTLLSPTGIVRSAGSPAATLTRIGRSLNELPPQCISLCTKDNSVLKAPRSREFSDTIQHTGVADEIDE